MYHISCPYITRILMGLLKGPHNGLLWHCSLFKTFRRILGPFQVVPLSQGQGTWSVAGGYLHAPMFLQSLSFLLWDLHPLCSCLPWEYHSHRQQFDKLNSPFTSKYSRTCLIRWGKGFAFTTSYWGLGSHLIRFQSGPVWLSTAPEQNPRKFSRDFWFVML